MRMPMQSHSLALSIVLRNFENQPQLPVKLAVCLWQQPRATHRTVFNATPATGKRAMALWTAWGMRITASALSVTASYISVFRLGVLGRLTSHTHTLILFLFSQLPWEKQRWISRAVPPVRSAPRLPMLSWRWLWEKPLPAVRETTAMAGKQLAAPNQEASEAARAPACCSPCFCFHWSCPLNSTPLPLNCGS